MLSVLVSSLLLASAAAQTSAAPVVLTKASYAVPKVCALLTTSKVAATGGSKCNYICGHPPSATYFSREIPKGAQCQDPVPHP